MKYKRKFPVEVVGYRTASIPVFDPQKKCVVDKWWSVKNDLHGDDDYIPWDSEEGSEIPPF